jgi:hypothetical protein
MPVAREFIHGAAWPEQLPISILKYPYPSESHTSNFPFIR